MGKPHCMGKNWGLLSNDGLGTLDVQGFQLCALAMYCHLLSAVTPDHALGISYFPFLYRKPFFGVYSCVQQNYLYTFRVQLLFTF